MYQRMSSAHPDSSKCLLGPQGYLQAPDCPPLGLPPSCPQPRSSCQPLGPSPPAPAMPQQGPSPAPHSPALLSCGIPLNWAHLWAQPVSIPRQVARPGAVLLLSGAGMGSGTKCCPDRPLEAAGPGGVLSVDFREEQWILSPTTYGFAVSFAAVAAAEWATAAVAGAGLFSAFRSEPPSPPAPWECSAPPASRCPWLPSAAPPPSRGVLLPHSGSRENRFNSENGALIYSCLFHMESLSEF